MSWGLKPQSFLEHPVHYPEISRSSTFHFCWQSVCLIFKSIYECFLPKSNLRPVLWSFRDLLGLQKFLNMLTTALLLMPNQKDHPVLTCMPKDKHRLRMTCLHIIKSRVAQLVKRCLLDELWIVQNFSDPSSFCQKVCHCRAQSGDPSSYREILWCSLINMQIVYQHQMQMMVSRSER